jgi:hypothetical protein
MPTDHAAEATAVRRACMTCAMSRVVSCSTLAPNIPDQYYSLGLSQYRTRDFSAHRSDLVALRHFEGSVPYLRRARATAIDSGSELSQTQAPRHSASPKRPSSIISVSSTSFIEKVRTARPVAALQHPSVPDALHRVPTPCLHRAPRGPAATVQPQLPSARRSIHLCTMSAAER